MNLYLLERKNFYYDESQMELTEDLRQKRAQLAKDVLTLVGENKITPKRDAYYIEVHEKIDSGYFECCVGYDLPAYCVYNDLPEDSSRKALNSLFENSNFTCETCVLGALMVSSILSLNDVHTNFGEKRVKPILLLKGLFSTKELILLEIAFEGGYKGLVNLNYICSNYERSDKIEIYDERGNITDLLDKKKIDKFVGMLDGNSNDITRICAIMNNIIENNGEFICQQG